MKQLRRDILRNLPGAAGDVYFHLGRHRGQQPCPAGYGGHGARQAPLYLLGGQALPSILEPMRRIAEMGHDVQGNCIPVDGKGYIDLDALRDMLDDSVELVSCMHVNNEVGAIQPIAEIAKLIAERAPQAKLHVDGVQAFMREPFPGRFVDMYTLSGHKIHGPKGVGALYVKKGVRLAPRPIGGGQESTMRSGTENTPGLMGLKTAIEEYGKLPDPRGRLHMLKRRLCAGLCESGAGVPA